MLLLMPNKMCATSSGSLSSVQSDHAVPKVLPKMFCYLQAKECGWRLVHVAARVGCFDWQPLGGLCRLHYFWRAQAEA